MSGSGRRASVMPLKNNMKVRETTKGGLCFLMEDSRSERSFISVRNRVDILSISLFIMDDDLMMIVSVGDKISSDGKDTVEIRQAVSTEENDLAEGEEECDDKHSLAVTALLGSLFFCGEGLILHDTLANGSNSDGLVLHQIAPLRFVRAS